MRSMPEPDGLERTLPVDLWDVMVGDVIHSSAMSFQEAEELVLSIRRNASLLYNTRIYAQEHKE
jgi:predicted component of type VI protein secretion system